MLLRTQRPASALKRVQAVSDGAANFADDIVSVPRLLPVHDSSAVV
jgi:hypothetical protein